MSRKRSLPYNQTSGTDTPASRPEFSASFTINTLHSCNLFGIPLVSYSTASNYQKYQELLKNKL